MTPPVPPAAAAGHPARSGYRPDIDGLRAIAVLAVIGFHAFPGWVQGGFIGVDVFFVISGFLISTIILEALARGRFSVASFYARRIRRIFPALVTVLLASLAAGWFLLFPDEYRQLGKHVAGGAAFVSNFVLWDESGYFDETAELKPLLHLWSLGIEEQFYIVYPLLLWVLWKRRWSFPLAIGTIAGVSFGINLLLTGSSPVAAFYAPQSRAWELMLGSLLAWMTCPRSSRWDGATSHGGDAGSPGSDATAQAGGPASTRTSDNVRSFLGATLLLAGLLTITPERAFPGWWALLPVVGTVLLISGGTDGWINRRMLAHRALVWFGLISYPLYLWHWPLLAFARIVEGETPSREVRLGAVASAVVLAWLTYRLIEKPFRFGGHAREKVPALVAGMLVAGLLGYAVYLRGGFASRPWAATAARVNAQFVGGSWKYEQNDTCLRQYPFAEARTLAWWFCMKSSDLPPTVLLLGNSVANQSYPGITLNPHLKHHSVLSIGTCDPAFDANPSPSGPCFGDRQVRQREFIDRIVATTPTLKFVLIDGLNRQPDAKYIALLQQRIDFLEQRGVRVIVLQPHLRPRFEPKACFPRPLKPASRDCSIPLADRVKLDRDFAPLREAIAASNPKVLFFDQNDVYCADGRCSRVRDGMPLDRDPNHMSEYGSLLVYERFVEWARTNVPQILNAN
jgi:peptidoglycan/LPS O-acetylase OafA/YrhL